MITIVKYGTTFKVDVSKKPSNTTYNTWAYIYKPTDKMPIAGTNFKDGTKTAEIKQWAINKIDSFYNDLLKKQLTNQ
jgi:hypothetical protein